VSNKQKEGEDDFSERVLMSLAGDVVALAEMMNRVRTQVEVLAREHGVSMPEAV
jgi:hypothetical protein